MKLSELWLSSQNICNISEKSKEKEEKNHRKKKEGSSWQRKGGWMGLNWEECEKGRGNAELRAGHTEPLALEANGKFGDILRSGCYNICILYKYKCVCQTHITFLDWEYVLRRKLFIAGSRFICFMN